MVIENSYRLNYDDFSTNTTLPLPKRNSFEYCHGWISSVIENKNNFSKYGGQLLAFKIDKGDIESIKEIYNKYIKDNKKIFSKYGDELLKFEIKEDNVELIKDIYNNNIKDNKKILLRYGVLLLIFGIEKHDVEYIGIIVDIYEKSIKYFEDDLRINKMFLSTITSTTKYSSEILMIIDSSINNIVGYRDSNLHFRSFQYPSIVNLTRSILWLKYSIFMLKIIPDVKYYSKFNNFSHFTYLFCHVLYIIKLSNYHFIYDFKIIFPIYYRITNIFKETFYPFYISTTAPTITFMNPYIKFVTYPQEYKWFLELFRPQFNPFVKTINSDIYKTWNGETIIDFKWNKFRKYYYTHLVVQYI